MKYTLVFTFLFLSSTFVSAQNSFQETAIKAKTESKNIVVIFSGSDWCKPCYNYNLDVLQTQPFKNFANQNFVFYIADFPRNTKLLSQQTVETNNALAEKWNNHGAFPFTIILDSNQNLLKNYSGAFKSTSAFKEWYLK